MWALQGTFTFNLAIKNFLDRDLNFAMVIVTRSSSGIMVVGPSLTRMNPHTRLIGKQSTSKIPTAMNNRPFSRNSVLAAVQLSMRDRRMPMVSQLCPYVFSLQVHRDQDDRAATYSNAAYSNALMCLADVAYM